MNVQRLIETHSTYEEPHNWAEQAKEALEQLQNALKQEAITLLQKQDEIEKLKQCLRLAYDDTMDYLTINKLGGENNHWLVLARKLLK